MNLLYLTFGNDSSVHLQAAFSIYSFLSKQNTINTVTIITDNDSFYQHLLPHVNIIQVTQDELKEWKGKHGFFWRIKIKAIEKICELYPGQPIIYLDTDTFLYTDLTHIQHSLSNGFALMHENEGVLSHKKSKTEKKMWHQIAGKTFGGMLMEPTDCMWNAGVVAIPNTKSGKDCKLALAICDEMCEKAVTERLIEQYALSLALAKTYGLDEAKAGIAHYWSTKDLWSKRITEFFLHAFFAQWNFEQLLDAMGKIDLSSIPVYQKVQYTNKQLKRMTDRLFSPKNQQHISKS